MVGSRFTSLVAFATIALSLSACTGAAPITQLAVDLNANPGFNASLVATQAVNTAAHSWEYGATAQTLLEVSGKSLSVFSTGEWVFVRREESKLTHRLTSSTLTQAPFRMAESRVQTRTLTL